MGDLLIEQIKKIEKGLKEYQPGDLISIGSIKELFDNLVNISLADYGKCKNLINLLETGKELFQKLLSNTTEDISKQLLLSILSNYRIYHEKKSIKDFFDKFKHFQKEFEQLNINYEPEVMCKEYTPGYFDNIIDDQKMLQEFVEECKDHLDNAQYKLLDLEYDYSNQEYINSVFRSFHTIKGSSAFLGIKNIEETAHSIENLLVIVRDGKLKVTKELIDVVFYGIGILRDLVLVIESEKYEKEKIIKCFKEILIFDYIDIVNAIRENYQTKKMGEILLDAGKINQEMIDDILRKQKEVDKKFGEIAVEENIVTEQDIREAVVKQQTAQKIR